MPELEKYTINKVYYKYGYTIPGSFKLYKRYEGTNKKCRSEEIFAGLEIKSKYKYRAYTISESYLT